MRKSPGHIVTTSGIVLLTTLCAPGAAVSQQNSGVPNLAGVWKPTHVSLDDPRWRIEDLACGGMCSIGQFEYLQLLLRDPGNDSKPVSALYDESYRHHLETSNSLLTGEGKIRVAEYELEEGAALDCSPEGDGWATQLFAPLPAEIVQLEDRVVIRYEYWNAERTIYLDGRKLPDSVPPSRLGYSIGRYDGDALVVETTNLLPGELYVPSDNNLVALTLSSDAVGIERYSLADSGDRLDLTWSVSDPVYLTEPVRGQKSVLRAPGWALEEFVCESITGEF